MNVDMKSAAAEIRRRERILRRKRKRNSAVRLGCICAVLAILLGLSVFSGGAVPICREQLAGGAFGAMLADGAGGYVLAAAAAFMLGVAVTVFCIRRRGGKADKNKSDDMTQRKN